MQQDDCSHNRLGGFKESHQQQNHEHHSKEQEDAENRITAHVLRIQAGSDRPVYRFQKVLRSFQRADSVENVCVHQERGNPSVIYLRRSRSSVEHLPLQLRQANTDVLK